MSMSTGQATTKGRWDLGDEDDKKKLEELEAEFQPLTTKLMMEVLGGKVENVIRSDGVVHSP